MGGGSVLNLAFKSLVPPGRCPSVFFLPSPSPSLFLSLALCPLFSIPLALHPSLQLSRFSFQLCHYQHRREMAAVHFRPQKS